MLNAHVPLVHSASPLVFALSRPFPAVLEGGLKLKEIPCIHAEAYPAGELKHGPLALVDEDMPVVIAPNDALLEKVKSNMQEVRAHGGELFVFADLGSHFSEADDVHVIPVQMLAYHVALARGTCRQAA